MKTGQKGIELIKEFEGFEPKVYKCPAGYDTIGYGTVIDTAEEKYLLEKTISKEEAEVLLRKDLDYFEKCVNKLLKSSVSQNQYDAVLSFTYNCGPGNLKSSTLLKKINRDPNDPTIAAEFRRWIYADGQKLLGLQRRREREAELYFML